MGRYESYVAPVVDKTWFVFGGTEGYEKNTIEKIGDVGLYPVTQLPKLAVNCVCNRKVIVVATGLLAVGAWSYYNYPDAISSAVQNLYGLTPEMPVGKGVEIIKGIVWALGTELALSLTARTYGRFDNEECVKKYWKNIMPDLTSKGLLTPPSKDAVDQK